MVVDSKVLRDRANANAAVTHRRNPRRDRLVDRHLNRLDQLSLNQNPGNGAKPLRFASTTPKSFWLRGLHAAGDKKQHHYKVSVKLTEYSPRRPD